MTTSISTLAGVVINGVTANMRRDAEDLRASIISAQGIDAFPENIAELRSRIDCIINDLKFIEEATRRAV